MAEIVDCTRGASEDLDYILLGEKPPYYTEDEWERMMNRKVDPKFEKQIFNLMDIFFEKL